MAPPSWPPRGSQIISLRFFQERLTRPAKEALLFLKKKKQKDSRTLAPRRYKRNRPRLVVKEVLRRFFSKKLLLLQAFFKGSSTIAMPVADVSSL